MKPLSFLLFFLVLLAGCTKEEPAVVVEEPPVVVSPDIREATYDYDFFAVENVMESLLTDYQNAYEFTQDPVAYGYGGVYELSQFHLALIVHDEANGNVPAVLVYRPAGSDFAPAAELASVVAQAEDGSSWIRQEDAELSRRMAGALQNIGGEIARYSEDETDFLVFRVERDRLLNIDRSFRTRQIAYFVYWGYLLYPRQTMERPGSSQENVRASIPENYPADPESFSLIGAGVKLGEDLLYAAEPVDWERALAMQYVILDRLRAADSSLQNYIDEYYLYYAWLEGAAQFAHQTITLGTGLYDRNDLVLREQVSYEAFTRDVTAVIDTDNTVMFINGFRRNGRYYTVARTSFYELGSTTFRILEGLGEDPFAAMTTGRNPYELLDDYITNNQIVIDEEATLADIKASIDWEASMALMADYIAYFN